MGEFQDKLPPNWLASSLGEICSQPQYGYTTKGSDTGTLRLLRTTDITSGNICWERVPFCLDNPTDEAKYLLKDGDIVISRAGSVGVSYLLKNPERSVFASYLIRFKPYISKQYFKYFLDSPYYWGEIADNKLGIAVPNVNASKLKEIAIPLPPENEQHRIVAKIEELFSELDKGIENLKTARAQLKVYRQALLKHAFEGKLTARWREENPGKLETADALLKRIQQERAQRYRQQLADWQVTGGSKPKVPKPLPPLTAEELAELPGLPDGWGWERLGNIADLIGGVTKGKNLEGKEKLSLPYLRVANVQDGYLDLAEIKHIEVETQDRGKYRLEFGDVLYTEGGDKDKLGRGAVWRNQIDSCIHQNHIFRARIFGGVISSEILSLYSQTKSAKKYFFRHAKQTTNLASINLTVLANLPVTIFSQREQQQVLLETESRLSECDQLDETLLTSLQQAEALRQSILKKAFSGQLVAQDANDEPASVLLARIKAESAAQAAIAKPNKPQKAQTQPAPVKTNVIPFPVKIANISTTDLHAGILARAYQHHEHTPKYLAYFGHVKAEKIAHMVEAHLGIDLGRKPVKAAAGPNDYPHLKKVESRAQKANWFNVRQQKDGRAYVFTKAQGFDDLLGKTRLALGDHAAAVDELMKLLLPLNTRQAEIVATLYAAWNNLLLLGRAPSDDDIVHEARENWHASKLEIERGKFFRGLEWMRRQGLVPAGKGRYVSRKDKSFEANV